METNEILKARWLIENMAPRYPLKLEWFIKQPELGFDKKVEIRANPLLPKEIIAFILPHRSLLYHYICFNPDHCIERIRFAIAHETGHLYLGHEGYSIGDDEPQDIKAEADNFGSEIIMPAFRVRAKAAQLYKLSPIHLVYNLKRYFWVSAEAMSRRLLDTGVFLGTYFLYDQNKCYYAYMTSGIAISIQMRKMLIDMYKTLRNKEYREMSYWEHGQNFKLYLHKFSNGKVFGAINIDTENYNCFRENSVFYFTSNF